MNKTEFPTMNKVESAKVSDLEDHISLKYEIKKRLGKGVSPVLPEVVILKLRTMTASYLNFMQTLTTTFTSNRPNSTSINLSGPRLPCKYRLARSLFNLATQSYEFADV